MTTVPDSEQPDRQRTFSWADPAAIAAAGAGMSGAEFFAAVSEGVIPPPPVMRALDFDGVFFADGRATFRLTPREFHYNPLGTVHGGVFATLLDSACGCAVHALAEGRITDAAGKVYVTATSSCLVMRPD